VHLALIHNGGIMLYDVVTDYATRVQGLGEIRDARLLAQP
jgi:hypothetical protein